MASLGLMSIRGYRQYLIKLCVGTASMGRELIYSLYYFWYNSFSVVSSSTIIAFDISDLNTSLSISFLYSLAGNLILQRLSPQKVSNTSYGSSCYSGNLGAFLAGLNIYMMNSKGISKLKSSLGNISA